MCLSAAILHVVVLMQGSVPNFEVELRHAQQLDSLARTERAMVDGQLKLRMSDHTDTGGVVSIKK